MIKAKRDDILNPLSAVSGIIERRHTLPILSNVLIERSGDALAFLATDIEIQIAARSAIGASAEARAVTVGARKLLDILRALPEGAEVTLTQQDKRLLVKAGKSRFTLQTLAAEDFPRLSRPGGEAARFELPQKALRRVLGDEGIRCRVATRTGPAQIAAALVERAVRSSTADSLTVIVAKPVPREQAARPAPLPRRNAMAHADGKRGPSRGLLEPGAELSALLELEDVVKHFPVKGTGRVVHAVNGVTLTVRRGETVGVVGESGCGKSTLGRLALRLIEPDRGSVRLDGQEITTLNGPALREARRRMAMIFQEFNLVERLTVMENVLSGRLGSVGFFAALFRRYPPRDINQAYALLDRVGLAGYQDTRADALSGGQRQRVGIARALMQEPDLLLVDEPTASLDPKTARQIMRLIRELAVERRRPALINIHDVALAQGFADRVVGLKAGAVAFDGAPATLTPAVLTEIYGDEDWSQTIRPVDDERVEAA